jgi:hypothetical protein
MTFLEEIQKAKREHNRDFLGLRSFIPLRLEQYKNLILNAARHGEVQIEFSESTLRLRELTDKPITNAITLLYMKEIAALLAAEGVRVYGPLENKNDHGVPYQVSIKVEL